MTSKIHVAIPNNTKMLVDLNAGYLRIGHIEGNYSKAIDYEVEKTDYGDHYQTMITGKRIHWGKLGSKRLPFNQTKTLEEIYNAEGEFAITSMEVQAPYENKVITNSVPSTVESIALFLFNSWSFKPAMIRKILDRMPSRALYDLIRQKRKEMNLSKETRKRQRDTWLINKMPEGIPAYVYKLWLDTSFAMILPESSSTFLGKELGTDYKEVF